MKGDMESGCPALEKWQMSVPLTENQSGVSFQILTLSILRCAVAVSEHEAGWKK